MKASNIIALDVGQKRIGVARASSLQGFATPLTTLSNDHTVWDAIQEIVVENEVVTIVVGLPRNLSGEDTQQTNYTRKFISDLSEKFPISIKTQDEALTSHKAKEELNSRKGSYQKPDVDALAATYILEDYINENRVQNA